MDKYVYVIPYIIYIILYNKCTIICSSQIQTMFRHHCVNVQISYEVLYTVSSSDILQRTVHHEGVYAECKYSFTEY